MTSVITTVQAQIAPPLHSKTEARLTKSANKINACARGYLAKSKVRAQQILQMNSPVPNSTKFPKRCEWIIREVRQGAPELISDGMTQQLFSFKGFSDYHTLCSSLTIHMSSLKQSAAEMIAFFDGAKEDPRLFPQLTSPDCISILMKSSAGLAVVAWMCTQPTFKPILASWTFDHHDLFSYTKLHIYHEKQTVPIHHYFDLMKAISLNLPLTDSLHYESFIRETIERCELPLLDYLHQESAFLANIMPMQSDPSSGLFLRCLRYGSTDVWNWLYSKPDLRPLWLEELTSERTEIVCRKAQQQSSDATVLLSQRIDPFYFAISEQNQALCDWFIAKMAQESHLSAALEWETFPGITTRELLAFAKDGQLKLFSKTIHDFVGHQAIKTLHKVFDQLNDHANKAAEALIRSDENLIALQKTQQLVTHYANELRSVRKQITAQQKQSPLPIDTRVITSCLDKSERQLQSLERLFRQAKTVRNPDQLQRLIQSIQSHLETVGDQLNHSKTFASQMLKRIETNPAEHLWYAYDQENLNSVLQLISFDPSLLNQQDDQGYTLLFRSIEAGRTEWVKALLSLDQPEADLIIEVEEETGTVVYHALFEALNHQQDPIYQALMDHCFQQGKVKEILATQSIVLEQSLQKQVETQVAVENFFIHQDLSLHHTVESLTDVARFDHFHEALLIQQQTLLQQFQNSAKNHAIKFQPGHSPSWLAGVDPQSSENRKFWRYVSADQNIHSAIQQQIHQISQVNSITQGEPFEALNALNQAIKQADNSILVLKQLRPDYLKQTQILLYEHLRDLLSQTVKERLQTEQTLLQQLDQLDIVMDNLLATPSPLFEWCKNCREAILPAQLLEHRPHGMSLNIFCDQISLKQLAQLPDGDLEEEIEIQIETLAHWISEHEAQRSFLHDCLLQIQQQVLPLMPVYP